MSEQLHNTITNTTMSEQLHNTITNTTMSEQLHNTITNTTMFVIVLCNCSDIVVFNY